MKNLINLILKESNTNYYQINNNPKHKGIKKVLAFSKKNIYEKTAIFKLLKKNNKLNEENNNDINTIIK